MKTEIYYQGHGSLRVTAADGYVIYVDPYAGDGYDVPADLILVTHQHHDHNQLDLPAKKPTCVIRQNDDFLQNGVYRAETFAGVTVRATQAYNGHHPRGECVGYLLTLDGLKIYVAGDTSRTDEMAALADEELDCAFLPIDGVYNMGPAEASACAELLRAKTVVPYHMAPGKLFDQKRAEKFDVPGRLIVPAGEEIVLE
ncbi:MAG: MBL fold metallo-hydrolase [Clostridia bacterium]|nr:MBL fold metallo-hydrolase [Clostridia bacterium]